jgi:ABC-type Fe3+-hydroxamate transport system substrate-binding protein
MQGCVSPTCDDLGRPVALPRAVRRVVSLVPSLTEAVAATAPGRMLAACRLGRPAWLDDAVTAWSEPDAPAPGQAGGRRNAVVPIWRRPWMALGRDTFAGDLLSRLRVDNVLAGSPERYPRIELAALPPYDVVVLPDEPYSFGADDGPEAFPGVPAALVSGRHLTWYGPSLVEAHDMLRRQLDV